MKVNNSAVIRRLSFRSLWAARKRNSIAVIAIILTALLFTSLFTIALSVNDSVETYTFRQIGGYSHGTFKEVNEEQITALSAHPKVKETGLRTTFGIISTGVFAKVPAELSYMDETCAKWHYIAPTAGRLPESGKEIAMDTGALRLLGIPPELGTQVTLTYMASDLYTFEQEVTDTFTLVGWWDYDTLTPVHFLNLSEAYVNNLSARMPAPFRTDLNVMMASGWDIEGQMQQVNTDMGYTWDDRTAENNVRIGVNWGYSSEQLLNNIDLGTMGAIAAFLLLVMFTGYLIIYNIFQISVTEDIRFYGLLKTVGVTPRQLRRIIRWQGLFLCTLGIPVGLLLGYGVGAVLAPIAMSGTVMAAVPTISVSPLIFLFSAAFSLCTVLLSCSRPGRMAAKVSPVEAVKYTDATSDLPHTLLAPLCKGSCRLGRLRGRYGKRSILPCCNNPSAPTGHLPLHRGGKIPVMARSNLSRNRKKTALVVISLCLSVVLLNTLTVFTGSFDSEKYVDHMVSADFIVSSPGYFRSHTADEYISEADLTDIQANTSASLSGICYDHTGYEPIVYMDKDKWWSDAAHFYGEMTETYLSTKPRKGDLVGEYAMLPGFDRALFEKMTVVEGDIAPLFDSNSNAIAISVYTDDFGNVSDRDFYPAIGEEITLEYPEELYIMDTRTGQPAGENLTQEYAKTVIVKSREVTYTVCALVDVPTNMSYRFSRIGYELVLPVERMEADSGQTAVPMLYLFDAPNAEAEAAAEAWLAELCKDDLSPLMYESKATKRAEFENLRSTFLLLGGLLIAVIAVIGLLNFINAVMTGILARRREFAVLQAVGMTGGQLQKMLVYEGLFYALGSAVAALVLCILSAPALTAVLERSFWFITVRFTLLPVLLALPLFALLGTAVPVVMYRYIAKQSIVDRLREV